VTLQPVHLPAKTTAGPPPHGPSPAALALTPTDLGTGTVTQQGYQVDTDLNPVSEYERDISPGGTFKIVEDEVTRWQTPTQANYVLTLLSHIVGSGQTLSGALGSSVTSFQSKGVPVRSGDTSSALLGTAHLANGKSFNIGFVLIRIGSTVEFVTVGTSEGAHLLPSALTQLAAIATARVDRGLHLKREMTDLRRFLIDAPISYACLRADSAS
jgi:hypothetical protein